MPASFSVASAEVSAEGSEVRFIADIPVPIVFSGALTTLAQGSVDARADKCPIDVDIPDSSTDVTAGGEIDVEIC